MPLIVRQAQQADRAALSRICLLTANAGTDGSANYSDPDYPGLVWSVPYLVHEPEFAFVAVDGDETFGYVVATADTEAFEARLDADWWPQLARHYAGRQPVAPSDKGVMDRFLDAPHSDLELLNDYPAHLHINLLPQAQSGGLGRKLIEAELAALRGAGIKGVHLGVNPDNHRAMGFYRHLGFEELGRDGGIVFGMRLS